jgi:hypothetical protein
VLTQGVIAFAALGGPGVQIDVTASLVSAEVGGVVLALLARSGVPAGGQRIDPFAVTSLFPEKKFSA